MLRLSLIFILIIVDIGLMAQPNSFYFMKGIPQTKAMNPAKHGMESGYYVSMPFISSLDLSANTNNWSYTDLVRKGTGVQKDSMIWDFEHLINSFDEKNFIQESFSLTLADFGWRKKEKFFSFSWSENELAEPFFEKELAKFLYYGNDPLIGKKFLSGEFGIFAQHYRQFAFTFSKQNTKKLSTGLTGKLLFGMAGLDTRGINFETDMPSSGETIHLSGNGNLFLSGPVEVSQNPDNYYDLKFSNTFNAAKYLLNFGNPGLALDLGLTYKITKKIELSASLIDLGFISWNTDLSSFSDHGSYPFEGIQLNAPGKSPPTADSFQPLLDELKDSIINAFPLELSSQRFSTLLPLKLFIGCEYNLTKRISMATLARIRLFNNQLHGAYTVTVNSSFGENLSISAGYSYYESSLNNIGAGISYKINDLQLYMATDNILSPFYPNRASLINLKFGINFIFPDENTIENRRTIFYPEVKRKRHRSYF